MPTEPWMWTNVKHMLQALSLPGEAQLRLYCDGSCKGDEFALDYDNWSRVLLGHDQSELAPDQRRKLIEIGEHFTSFSGQENSEYWTDDAILRNPHWEKVRSLAVEALKLLGWEVVPPPREWVAKFLYGQAWSGPSSPAHLPPETPQS